MPFATAALIATAVGVAGAAASGISAIEGMNAQQEVSDDEKKANQIKEIQMNLDTARQNRDIARRAIMARSQALTNATSQGAEFGSGLQGGYGQITGQAGAGYQALNQNFQTGQQLFQANDAIVDAQSNVNFWQGVGSFGRDLYQNRDTLGRVGAYATGAFF